MNSVASVRDSTQRFSDRVEYYVRSRPHYPIALLEFFQTQLHLKPDHRIADIGSGTGILTQLFLKNTNPVFAVEPNQPMREAAEKSLANHQNFHSISATAEATTLPTANFQFVIAGQAFHWFDRSRAKQEFKRILTPNGYVVLIWNERRLNDPGFAQAYEKLIKDFAIDLPQVRRQTITAVDSKVLADFFAPAGYRTESFDNPQALDLNGLLDRALSSSYLPLPGHPRCNEMLEELRKIFAQYAIDGQVWQNYDTRAYYGQLK